MFESIESVLDPEVYREHYPDWRVSQSEAVAAVCADPAASVWIAIAYGAPAGFVALKFHEAERMGEIYMIAVDPDFQRRGIAKALTEHAMRTVPRDRHDDGDGGDGRRSGARARPANL